MKKIVVAALIVVFAVLWAFIYAGSRPKTGGSDKTESDAAGLNKNIQYAGEKATTTAETKDKKYKVTFIELGSVRCIPCKAMIPIMNEVEEKYGSEVKVIFYDVWTAAGQPYEEQYRVFGIPTQVFLDSEGKEFYRHQGFFPKPELFEILKKQGVKID